MTNHRMQYRQYYYYRVGPIQNQNDTTFFWGVTKVSESAYVHLIIFKKKNSDVFGDISLKMLLGQ